MAIYSSLSFNKVFLLLSQGLLVLEIILVIGGIQQQHHHQCDAFAPSLTSRSVKTFKLNSPCFQCSSSVSRRTSYLERELTKLHQSKSSQGDNDSHDEVNEIRDMILSISLEADDEKRRGRVSSVLEEKLNQKDVNNSARFAYLWDTTLIQIGGEIQNKARIDAEKQSNESMPTPQSLATTDSDGDGDDDGEREGGGVRTKSAAELQLWSMVDMMVQSKSLIKKLMNE